MIRNTDIGRHGWMHGRESQVHIRACSVLEICANESSGVEEQRSGSAGVESKPFPLFMHTCTDRTHGDKDALGATF